MVGRIQIFVYEECRVRRTVEDLGGDVTPFRGLGWFEDRLVGASDQDM